MVMAPKNFRFVFLSATVTNAKEFSDWVAKHHLFPSGGDGLYLVVDEKGTFWEDSFQKVVNALAAASNSGSKRRENGKWQKAGNSGEESNIFKLVKIIMQRQYDADIIFSFSKRDCEILAMQTLHMLKSYFMKISKDVYIWSVLASSIMFPYSSMVYYYM
eukprot:Gb_37471 [translate_table: standard]